MDENTNVSSEITKYIKEKGRKVSASEIYTHFKKEGKTHGQISGALNRLKQTGQIVSPERAIYENTKSSNVLNEMEQDIKKLVYKYNHSVPITIYDGLDQIDKEKYTKIIQSLQALVD